MKIVKIYFQKAQLIEKEIENYFQICFGSKIIHALPSKTKIENVNFFSKLYLNFENKKSGHLMKRKKLMCQI